MAGEPPGASDPPRTPDALWLAFGARLEARQHVSRPARAALMAALQCTSSRRVAAATIVASHDRDATVSSRSGFIAHADQRLWLFEACLRLELLEETWRVQQVLDPDLLDAALMTGDVALDHRQAEVYAPWILGWDTRPAPSGVASRHRRTAYTMLRQLPRVAPDVLQSLLREIEGGSNDERAWASLALEGAARAGSQLVIEAYLDILVSRNGQDDEPCLGVLDIFGRIVEEGTPSSATLQMIAENRSTAQASVAAWLLRCLPHDEVRLHLAWIGRAGRGRVPS